jgi:hypothetical protein
MHSDEFIYLSVFKGFILLVHDRNRHRMNCGAGCQPFDAMLFRKQKNRGNT